MRPPFLSEPEIWKYKNADDLCRRWVFTSPYKPLDAEPGERLYQDDQGFHIRDKAGTLDSARYLETWQMADLLPALDDPPYDEIVTAFKRATAAVDGLTPALADLVCLAPLLAIHAAERLPKVTEALRKERPKQEKRETGFRPDPDNPQVARAVERLDRIVAPEYRRYYSAYVMLKPVPEAGIRAGDLILHACMSMRKGERDRIRGTLHPIARGTFPAIMARSDALRLLHSRHETWTEESVRSNLLRSLDRIVKRYVRNGVELNPASSPLTLLRPYQSDVGLSVEARTDDAAIFELLAEVGCRMPAREVCDV